MDKNIGLQGAQCSDLNIMISILFVKNFSQKLKTTYTLVIYKVFPGPTSLDHLNQRVAYVGLRITFTKYS